MNVNWDLSAEQAGFSDELRQGLEEHLEQTKGHVARLEQIFEMLDESPKGKKCAGMAGLVEVMKEGLEGAVLDAALIGAAQRVEHYEIAAYGTVIAFAETLGESDHAALLEETLSEEEETDEKLTELTVQINKLAASGDRIQPAPGRSIGQEAHETNCVIARDRPSCPRPRSRTWAGLLPPL